VSAYRDLGYLPEAMVKTLALLGWSFDGQREIFALAELEQAFRLERVGSNPRDLQQREAGMDERPASARAERVIAWSG
jgi:glutamyl/glutaminyl-tRNA synthetase